MWLALDTATDRASVALGDLGGEPIEESMSGARRHAAALVPMIQALLRRRAAGSRELEGIALSDGPGSFTGLRVGSALAKAMAHTHGIPLWTAPSLMVRAAGLAGDGQVVLSVANALRGEVYAGAFRFTFDRVETLIPAEVITVDALMAHPFRADRLVGEAPDEIAARLERWSGLSMVRPPEGSPHAGRLLGLVGRPGGATRVEARAWEPAYGRPAEAQARWEKAHGRSLPDSVGRTG